MSEATKNGGPWQPANEAELDWLKRTLCAHCLDRNGEGDWEDEFGQDVPGECVLHYYAFIGPTEQWSVTNGKPDCTCFVEDPDNPARCPDTMEMFE